MLIKIKMQYKRQNEIKNIRKRNKTRMEKTK